MVGFRQVVFSLFTTTFWRHLPEEPHVKSIAVVGAGSAGLAMVKTLLELPDEIRKDWNIVLFEQRKDVGGIWLPDPNPPPPPTLPETPLYLRLHTNTPVPSMTYPGNPFPPNTPLFPSAEYVENYHRDYATRYNIYPHIRLNHTVLDASWVGSSVRGHWNLTYRDNLNKTKRESFDHLVVASGHNHHPYSPSWPGQEEWLASGTSGRPKREIFHTMWYREPQRFANQTVVVVGGGASGADSATQIAPVANKTYLSSKRDYRPDLILGKDIIRKPEISHFTANDVVFQDKTRVAADSVLLGTGYELRIPFLDEGNALRTDPRAHSNVTYTQGLVTNLRYLFPLHKHVISLCPSYPTNALSFIGLPLFIANAPSDFAQSLLVTHSIVNASLLPSREEMLYELALYEENLREQGFDPYNHGHRLLANTSNDYQDELVDFLKQRGAIPDDGKKYVEDWRREITNYQYLKKGWNRVEALGIQKQWLEGVESEAQWADMMRRLETWQGNWERQHA